MYRPTLLFAALLVHAAAGTELTVDLSNDCNQVFSLVKNVSESFTLLSHNQFGDGSYSRGVRCGAKFDLEACEEARLDCSGEGNFDVLCRGILGDHLQVDDGNILLGDYCDESYPMNKTFDNNTDEIYIQFRTNLLRQGDGFRCSLTCDEFKADAVEGATKQQSANPPAGCVCGLSDLPDPSEDAFFNNLASFPIFGEDIGNFDPNDTDAMTGFQKPNMANMSSRAETARLLKVVGGVAAQPGEIRWQVGMTRSPSNVPVFIFCGATLLNELYVMTAAHCTSGRAADTMHAVIGMTDRYHPEEGEIIRFAPQKYQHSQYNSATTNYDYSVLKLSRAVDFTDPKMAKVSPICWPSGRPAPGDSVVISGWGTLSAGGSGPDVLQRATVQIVSTSDCNSRDSYSGRITPAMICAGIYPNGGIDTCQGDSGGPMVTKVGANYELVGATSWGRGCAWRSLPGIYADIRHVFSWVRQVVSNGECPRN